MQPSQQSETQQAVENQEQRYDVVEEARHDQDQSARNERHDRRDVGDRQGHLKALRDSDRGKVDSGPHSIVGALRIGDASGRRKVPHITKIA